MNTRRTGIGDHRADRRCTQPASSAFWDADNEAFPSTPAVWRPALNSATRRTLDHSVRPGAEHQPLEAADPFEVPSPRCREDALP
jgi:hypothetical protein